MRLERTAARAKNGIINSAQFPYLEFQTCQSSDGQIFIASSKDIPEFGNNKTHYNYKISISVSELISLIEAAAKSDSDTKAHIKKSLEGHLGKLIKLVNLCAD